MTAAKHHYALAEKLAERATRVWNTGVWMPMHQAEADHALRLARLHLDLARGADDVLRSVDTRRDYDEMESGAGWPPVAGDIWRDGEGLIWLCESSGQLVCLNDGTVASPDEAHPALMRLAYRPYVPGTDPFDTECPF